MSDGIGKRCLELAESFTMGAHGYGAKYQDPDPKKVFSIGARRHELSRSIVSHFEATDDPHMDEENKDGKLVAELEGQVDTLTEEATDLTRMGEELKVNNDSLTKLIEDIRKESEEADETIVALEERVTALSERNETLESELIEAGAASDAPKESMESDAGKGGSAEVQARD